MGYYIPAKMLKNTCTTDKYTEIDSYNNPHINRSFVFKQETKTENTKKNRQPHRPI